MLDGKFNIHWNKGKKEKMRLSKWITCETDSDEENLEDRFAPTQEELDRNDKLNRKAKNHQKV